MALRNPIKKVKLTYRWRLFIPTVILVWAIIAILVTWEYRNEKQYRSEFIRSELAMIDSRILYAYERHLDIPDFVEFLGQYYDNSIFDEIYVSVYDENDKLLVHIGEPLPLDHDEFEVAQEYETPDDSRQALVRKADEQRMFFFTTASSRDGNLTVCTAMPHTFSISRAVAGDGSIWILTFLLTAVATVVVYLSTQLLTRNITLLRDFANRAAEGKPIENIDKLPHDELGDISREIIRIYQQRVKAIEKSSREHRIALHAVEEKSRLRRQLTNNINHELKTPIGVIRGYLDTILDNPDMDDATRNHFLARTLDNVERLCALMNDISTMTRLEEGTDNIPLSDVNMHDLLYAIENDVEASNLAGDMKFGFEVPLDCHVKGNQNLLSGLIMNLIKNSAMHSHGTEMKMSLVSESPKFYVFAFYDNGTGVSPEHLSHLFERFYRVDTGRSRKVGGTGLGLSIVKSTITSLGGTVSVHNRSAGGLEFVFSLRKWE